MANKKIADMIATAITNMLNIVYIWECLLVHVRSLQASDVLAHMKAISMDSAEVFASLFCMTIKNRLYGMQIGTGGIYYSSKS